MTLREEIAYMLTGGGVDTDWDLADEMADEIIAKVREHDDKNPTHVMKMVEAKTIERVLAAVEQCRIYGWAGNDGIEAALKAIKGVGDGY